ncbi:HET-domain-containing protein [Stipitochalara longipes BDJ]|nr:HET-domain-containing protein [Stipitochalara longipes BDJ]
MDETLSKKLELLDLGHPTSGRQSPPPRCASGYIYEPLKEPSQVRILKLHATKERIECSLQQIKISDGGYQALSYVWGKPEKPFSAFVLGENGEELGYIPLTENLQDALCDLRDAAEIKNKTFWIDQICIEQEGEEKNDQVHMMGDIYRHAARVITYVGSAAPDEEEERHGISLLNRLHTHFSPNHEPIFLANGLSSAWPIKRNLPVVTLPEDIQDKAIYDEAKYVPWGWRWLLHVAYGEWTQRLWIVQEQCLNREVVMLHGTTLLSWDAVATLPLMFGLELLPRPYVELFERRTLTGSGRTLVEIDDSVYHMWHTRKLQRKTQRTNAVHDLLLNITVHQSLQCWDLRDRIFALLAISRDADVLGIIPDYSTPSHLVFLEASVRILQTFPNLAPLAFAIRWARNRESEKLPSMSETSLTSVLPSWALRPAPRPVPHGIHFGGCKAHPRNSIRNRPCRFRLDRSVLVVKGRVLDRIAMSTPAVFTPRLNSFTRNSTIIQNFSKFMINWRAVLSYLGITFRNVSGLCRVIAATPLWAPLHREGFSADQSATFEFWSTCRRWVLHNNSHDFPVGPEVESMLKQCDSLIQELATALSEEEVFHANNPLTNDEVEASDNLIPYALLQGRSYCVTEEGRACNAMHEPEKGDRVAAFEGSDRLFILRPVGDKFQLVGEAYVDGWMNGEAYEGLDPDEVDYDIELV